MVKAPLVIIGGGGAAAHAVEAIRRNGYQGEIHLFSDSGHPPFNPMLITYYLSGKIPLERCYLFGEDESFFRENQVSWHKGSPVVDLDVREQAVTNAHGEKIRYQSCLIASGASAVIPPIPGSGSRRVFSIRTIEEAVRLKEYCQKRPKRVLIVGASMVGIKLVEMFQEAGSQVVLLDLAPFIFPQAAHPQCARIMEKQLQERGVDLLFHTRIEGVEEAGGHLKVSLSANQPDLEVDLLVFCIGVRPNLEFLQPGDLETEKGILVDEGMRTSNHSIYAAGDVAQGLNLISGRKEVIALWANACQQGRTAGANMAGGKAIYPGSIPQNITHFLDIFFVSIGDIHHADEVQERCGSDDRIWVFRKEGRICGINILNIGNYESINSAGVLRYRLLKNLKGGIGDGYGHHSPEIDLRNL